MFKKYFSHGLIFPLIGRKYFPYQNEKKYFSKVFFNISYHISDPQPPIRTPIQHFKENIFFRTKHTLVIDI